MTNKTNNGEQLCEYQNWLETCEKPATYTLRLSNGVCHLCKEHHQKYKEQIAGMKG